MRAPSFVALASLVLAGCGGAGPLLHPAHVLRPGHVTLGAGVSAQAPVTAEALVDRGDRAGEALSDAAVAPGAAPVVAARYGLAGRNEAGLAYLGRSLRLDGRHAFGDGKVALSLGLGGSVVLPERPGADAERGVYGGGLDVPILVGYSSTSDLYQAWIGPRASFEWLGGRVAAGLVDPAAAPGEAYEVDGRHLALGGLAGVRVGFRHVHVALEIDAAWHRVSGSVGPEAVTLRRFALAPAGALQLSF